MLLARLVGTFSRCEQVPDGWRCPFAFRHYIRRVQFLSGVFASLHAVDRFIVPENASGRADVPSTFQI